MWWVVGELYIRTEGTPIKNFRRVGAWIEVVSSGGEGGDFRYAVSSDRGVGF